MKSLTLTLKSSDGTATEAYLPSTAMFPISVGRSAEHADVVIEDPSQRVSRHQFDVERTKTGYEIVNRGQTMRQADDDATVERGCRMMVSDGLSLTAGQNMFTFRLHTALRPTHVLNIAYGSHTSAYRFHERQLIRVGSDRSVNEVAVGKEFGISAKHLRISLTQGGQRQVRLQDRNSRNGVFVPDTGSGDLPHLVKVENVEIGLGQPFCFGQVRGSVVPLKKGCVPLPLMLVAVAVVGIGAGVWLKHIKQPDKPIDPDPDTNAPPVIITPPKVNETLCDMWNRIKKEEDALKRINSLTAFQDNHTGEIRTATASLIDILTTYKDFDTQAGAVSQEVERVRTKITRTFWMVDSYATNRLGLVHVVSASKRIEAARKACADNPYLTTTQRIDVAADLTAWQEKTDRERAGLADRVAAIATAKQSLAGWLQNPLSYDTGRFLLWREALRRLALDGHASGVEAVERLCKETHAAWRALFAAVTDKANNPTQKITPPSLPETETAQLPDDLKKIFAQDACRDVFHELRETVTRPLDSGPEGLITWAKGVEEQLAQLDTSPWKADASDAMKVLAQARDKAVLAILEDSVRRVKALSDAVQDGRAQLIARAMIPPETLAVYERQLSAEKRETLRKLCGEGLGKIRDTCEKRWAEGEQNKVINPALLETCRADVRAVMDFLRKAYGASELPNWADKLWRWCEQ